MRSLKPFVPFESSIALSGSVSREEGLLRIRFALLDPKSEVLGGLLDGSRPGAEVFRADLLWQATCFEVFWGEAGSAAYWELNIAPSGQQWNLYRFDEYRIPKPPARSEDFVLERISVKAGLLDCELSARRSLGALEASLCAVIRTASGPHFFSITHGGDKADFHLRKSFSVKLG